MCIDEILYIFSQYKAMPKIIGVTRQKKQKQFPTPASLRHLNTTILRKMFYTSSLSLNFYFAIKFTFAKC